MRILRLSWRAALAAHFSAGLAGCLGPHVSIELIGGFVLAKGIGNVLLYSALRAAVASFSFVELMNVLRVRSAHFG